MNDSLEKDIKEKVSNLKAFVKEKGKGFHSKIVQQIIFVVIFALIVGFGTLFTINYGSKDTYTKVDNKEFAMQKVVVHVKGGVNNPGVYELQINKRVNDAINAAGGFTKNANSDSINLAAIIKDGQEIVVPEVVDAKATSSDSGKTNSEGKININTASAEELDKLSGIGSVISKRIIEYRENISKFNNISDIMKVSGIGNSLYEKIKNSITVK